MSEEADRHLTQLAIGMARHMHEIEWEIGPQFGFANKNTKVCPHFDQYRAAGRLRVATCKRVIKESMDA